MFNKRIWTLLLVLALVFALGSCTEECTHVDADDDYYCDNCGEHFDDGDENAGGEEPALPTATFTVVLDNGNAIAGVKFMLTRSGKVYEFTTDNSGVAKGELEAGLYYLDFDYDSLPSGCLPEDSGIRIEEGENNISLRVIDNTPDGSAGKPFTLSENLTEITLAPGQELYYNYRGSTVKYLSVDKEGIVISLGGDSYSLALGNLPLTITPDIGTETIFSVKNTTSAEISFTLSLLSPEGSYENPYELDANEMSVVVNCDTVVYYSWTAPADGILTLVCENERNNITVRRVLEGDVPVDRNTAGNSSVYIEVMKGDVITISVSALEATKDHENQDYDIELSFFLIMEYYD